MKQKWVSEGLFEDSKEALKFRNKNKRWCSYRIENKYGKKELLIKTPI